MTFGADVSWPQCPKGLGIPEKRTEGRPMPTSSARFVVLGEGASEEVVLPRVAEALGLAIDRSFVAVVPLGGRHVNHLWRLLTDLDLPHATLLDLDWGRAGGGWGRIKTACTQLLENGVAPEKLFGDRLNPVGGGAP